MNKSFIFLRLFNRVLLRGTTMTLVPKYVDFNRTNWRERAIVEHDPEWNNEEIKFHGGWREKFQMTTTTFIIVEFEMHKNGAENEFLLNKKFQRRGKEKKT
jgi:hypothetical protein